MTRTFAVLLGAVAALACGGSILADEGRLYDDFESPASSEKWEFSSGPEFPGAKGMVEVSDDEARSGKRSGALRFDFSGGGNYVQVFTRLEEPAEVSHIRLWIKHDGSNRLTLRVTDSDQQTFQKNFHFKYPGWQEVRLSLSGWASHWGGKNDGVFRGALTQAGLIVENDAERKGTVYIDDVRLISGGGAAAKSSSSTYTAFDFLETEVWGIAGEGDTGKTAWNAPRLDYDFTKGASTAGVQTDVALMGSPGKLRLRLISDGSGHAVRVRLASHFQTFDKVIGTLSNMGETAFEAELGALPDWRHYGGENDGIVRTPLRLTGILIDKAGDSGSGSIELMEMDVQTSIPARQQVVLVPDGRMRDGDGWFACEIRNLLGRDSDGELRWTIRDWSGQEILEQRQKLAIPRGKSARHEFITPGRNRTYLECEFRYVEGPDDFGPVTSSAVAPLEGVGDAVLRPESPFGMGLYLYRYPGNDWGYGMMDKAASLARAAGVKWTREEFQWHRIEPAKDKFDFSYYDRLIEIANRHGISVYGLIAYWSNWTEPYTEQGVRDYAAYCRALVTHFKDRIKHWEVWNEPNIFFWSGPKELYADLLKEAYKAIKEADPEALVLGCSTAGIDHGFIKMVMDSGAKFDILTIHPYRGSLDDKGFMKELRDAADLTRQIDGEAKPVWNTEMGLPTQLNGGLSERNQATFLARCYLSAVASGVDTTISWYDFREDGDNPFYNEHRFGVVRNRDLSPKPAYRALATVCRTLADKKVTNEIDLGEGLLAFRFAGGGEETVVVWSSGKDSVLSFESDSPPDALVDLMGSPVEHITHGGRMVVALRANSPVFISGSSVRLRASEAVNTQVPSSVHPGDRFTLRVRLQGSPDLQAKLSGLDGWVQGDAARAEGGWLRWDVRTPGTAAPERHEFSLVLSTGGQSLRVPIGIDVVSALLER